MNNHQDAISFIWSVADLLRGDYKASEYQKVVLPFTVLRRLDSVLEPTKAEVLTKSKSLPDTVDDTMKDAILSKAAGHSFYNTSPFTIQSLLGDPDHIAANLHNYLNGFPKGIQEVFIDRFKLPEQIDRLDTSNLLFMVVGKFAQISLGADEVDNHHMGLIFEELIRKFSEQSNETAGEHFTPREVIRLMVNLLFIEDGNALSQKGIIRTLYDPACGTGGMLSVGEEYLRELNPNATMEVFGQELNGESYAICRSDMMIKGQKAANIKFGNSFSEDGLPDHTFDYMLSNPPFGVEWKKVEKEIRDEAESRGFAGRFGAGLPRVSDGSLLFVQHMISKFHKNGQSSRLAVVLNGSPLFTGGAGSGESEIRRWIIENDWLEAIVALPDQLFYNTGISTYIWIVTNQKIAERRGKVQLINGANLFAKMRKSLGDKRKYVSDEGITEITRLFGDFAETEISKIFDNEDFGFERITVERPLKLNFQITDERIAAMGEQSTFTNLVKSRKKGEAAKKEIAEGKALQDAILAALNANRGETLWKSRDAFVKHLKGLFKAANVALPANLSKAIWMGLSERDDTADVCETKGKPEPDPDLRDNENVPLKEDIEAYFAREVLPHVSDAWIDESKTKRGYEIPFTRHFYQYVPPRPLEEIDAELKSLGAEIQAMLGEVMG